MDTYRYVAGIFLFKWSRWYTAPRYVLLGIISTVPFRTGTRLPGTAVVGGSEARPQYLQY